MPLFYFDLYDGETIVRDDFGIELDNVADAAQQAAALLPDVALEVLPGHAARDFAAFVRDENDVLVHRAALIFRSHWLDPTSASGASSPGPTGDVAVPSGRACEEARRLAAKLDLDLSEFLGAIRRIAQTCGT